MTILELLGSDDLNDATNTQRAALAAQAVQSAPSVTARKQVLAAAASELTPEQRAELAESWMPQKSADRRTVYVTGFIAAALLALGLSAFAWGAATSDAGDVATALVAAAVSLPSAIIAGLLGAYTPRG